MRQSFAHEAVLALGDEADERAPGAAVTVALCGHWEHEPPCSLARTTFAPNESRTVSASAFFSPLTLRTNWRCAAGSTWRSRANGPCRTTSQPHGGCGVAGLASSPLMR